MRIYAIGDIHGQLEMLEAAHERIADDRARTGDDAAPVVHLGDLVDRGPDSRGVIAYLIDGIAAGQPWIAIKGNHDQMFRDQLRDEPVGRAPFDAWMSANMGGGATMASYGVTPRSWATSRRQRRELADTVPEAHVAFLDGLPAYHETPHLLFVHAGIRPGLPLSDQIEEDLMWIRYDFLDDPRDHGPLVVHGHTPVDAPMHCGNRVNLDSGAGFGRPLTAAVFEGRDVWVLGPEGREPLLP
ncbi:MAG: serine/threonine protein phosphatase [Alphaproteobacteria bacterium]|nr:serine/threonine protein phosphatase [Alphaproteobacteria bacterium]